MQLLNPVELEVLTREEVDFRAYRTLPRPVPWATWEQTYQSCLMSSES